MSIYTLEAYWPNAAFGPRREPFDSLTAATCRAIELRDSLRHTTIRVMANDAQLELVKLWGGPESYAGPDDITGKAWP